MASRIYFTSGAQSTPGNHQRYSSIFTVHRVRGVCKNCSNVNPQSNVSREIDELMCEETNHVKLIRLVTKILSRCIVD